MSREGVRVATRFHRGVVTGLISSRVPAAWRMGQDRRGWRGRWVAGKEGRLAEEVDTA